MDSTLDRKTVGADDNLEPIGKEEGITNDYEGIAREITRARQRISKPAQAVASSNSQITTTPSPSPANDTQVRERLSAPYASVMRGFIVTVLFACIVVTAIFWQSSYFAWIRPTITRWMSASGPAYSLFEGPRAIEETSQPRPRIAAGAAPLQTAPLPQIAADDVASTAGHISPELVQLRDALALEVANMAQEVEQLRNRQDQLASENARTAEQLKATQEQLAREAARTDGQLKASQEQLTRIMTKPSERNPRPRIAARR